jgi:hypothetical protein
MNGWQRRGPQRSVDYIVSYALILLLGLLILLTAFLLADDPGMLHVNWSEAGRVLCIASAAFAFPSTLSHWWLCAWCTSLSAPVLRLMVLGSRVARKRKCVSILLTEQVQARRVAA